MNDELSYLRAAVDDLAGALNRDGSRLGVSERYQVNQLLREAIDCVNGAVLVARKREVSRGQNPTN